MSGGLTRDYSVNGTSGEYFITSCKSHSNSLQMSSMIFKLTNSLRHILAAVEEDMPVNLMNSILLIFFLINVICNGSKDIISIFTSNNSLPY